MTDTEGRRPISFEAHPDNERVIDAFISGIYESETFNHFANEYAMEVLHHYFGEFDHEWYTNWIGTEEFRGGVLPGNIPMSRAALLRYEKMYDLYWDARGEWFNLMIQNVARQNLREQHRMMYMHTLTNNQTWEQFGETARQPENRVTHQLKEDES